MSETEIKTMNTPLDQPVVVSFNGLQEGTAEDFLQMGDSYRAMCTGDALAGRALILLQCQKGMNGGAKIDLFQHALQTATRAYRDGADEETVVVALLHDIGELLGPSNHGELAAALLRPYISDRNWWILQHHEVFQGYYYFHLVGGDRNKREIYKASPHYQACVDFCEKWDAPSFDPDYPCMDLEEFRPMVHRIFSRKPFFNHPEDPKAMAVVGKADAGSG